MREKSGFTLVEILIVVVILGILAAIVIPQFTGASTEAKESSLRSNLQAMRSQIELYKIQHNDDLPGSTTGVDFTAALTSKTNQDGVVDTSGGTDGTFRFGPYMRSLPENPFNDLATVGEGITRLLGTEAGDDSTGWYFVTAGVDAGMFQANDDDQSAIDDDYHTNY
ncbi:MAG: prepilin-type N-terminal cleavage/methylation domain-containing protein [Planctomycetes bacterium]|nr:prepilin-type N-terminal cleavage/methylation domain-containing protein [Planctomycetota bacterium]